MRSFLRPKYPTHQRSPVGFLRVAALVLGALLALLFALLAGCSYDSVGLTDLRCEEEGRRSGDRVCRDGFWVGLGDAGPTDIGPADIGSDACVPSTCSEAQAVCGLVEDGCGGLLNCGLCEGSNQTCEDNRCVCDPKSCQELGAECGVVNNGCGAMINCGSSCPGERETCRGSQCVCEPFECAELPEIECGETDDGCGGTINCGMCEGTGELCGALEDNECDCIPETDAEFCARLGKDCGQVTGEDNCGVTRTDVECGMCNGAVCNDNVCGCPCDISGTCYPTGAKNPGNECEVCDPATSTTGWTPRSGVACSSDGVACTTDMCDAGSCEHTLDAGSCLVDDVCYVAGQARNSIDHCQICDPMRSTTSLSLRDDTCRVGGVCYNSGESSVGQPCRICNPKIQSDALTLRDDACLINGTCYADGQSAGGADFCRVCDVDVNQKLLSLRPDTCRIGGVCYNAGEARAGTSCEICDPIRSSGDFSRRAGTCLIGGTCYADGEPESDAQFCRVCDADIDAFVDRSGTCSIGGSCYWSGTLDPANPCQSCQSTVDDASWTPTAPKSCTPSSPEPGCRYVCETGACVLTDDQCSIDGACYADLARSPSNDCLFCDVDIGPVGGPTTTWSERPTNVLCDETGTDDGLCDDSSPARCIACSADETCDNGLDDDCDGIVDQGCPCTYDADGDGAPDAVGVCSDGGTISAVNGVCTEPASFSSDETAPEDCEDGLDNDCDGVTDEGCTCLFDADGDGTGEDEGVCKNGTLSDTVSGECDAPTDFEMPESSLCDDDSDNDCDGLTDCDDPDCDGETCTLSGGGSGMCAYDSMNATGSCQ